MRRRRRICKRGRRRKEPTKRGKAAREFRKQQSRGIELPERDRAYPSPDRDSPPIGGEGVALQRRNRSRTESRERDDGVKRRRRYFFFIFFNCFESVVQAILSSLLFFFFKGIIT